MLVPAVTGYDVVMAVHIMAVVIAFGWTFSLPVVYAVAAKRDPRSLPVLHRIELLIFRYVLNPSLLVVLGAGIFLASDGHHWKEFFVQWGLAAVIVIGGLVGAVLMPASRGAEESVTPDLASPELARSALRSAAARCLPPRRRYHPVVTLRPWTAAIELRSWVRPVRSAL